MKTNLLAQNDDLVIENLKAHVGKSVIDLSHSVTFPIDVNGALLPICCIETVPSDSFEISVECLLRQLTPLKVPLMTNLRLNTAFYYCDNRLAWKKWDRFMTGGRSGSENYDIPRCSNSRRTKTNYPIKYKLVDKSSSSGYAGYFKNINWMSSLHTYFGICMHTEDDPNVQYDSYKDDSDELPVAFPFFDYQIIKRDFYTNLDRLPENCSSSVPEFYNFDDLNCDWSYSNLFPEDDDEIRLIDGPQIKSGFVSGDDTDSSSMRGFLLDKVRYHDVRPDYFTSSKPAPMRGSAPELTASAATLVLPAGTKLTMTDDDLKVKGAVSYRVGVETIDADLKAKVKMNSAGTHLDGVTSTDSIPAGSLQSAGVYHVGTDGSLELKNDVSVTGQLSSTFTAADIRLLSQLTIWKELNMLHDPYYDDFLNAHFDNVRVGESAVEKPQYIGGTSQLISINEILQTSQTTTGSSGSPLGNQGATAMSLANNFVGRYYCNNYGYILGIAYIIPEMIYEPAMPRHFSRRAKEDYYSPEFANLSMQATLNKEIFFSNDDDWNNQPWGYTGAFDELRSIPNRIAGALLDTNTQDIRHWVLTRPMDNSNKPAMESTWLSLKNNVDTAAWQVQYYPDGITPFPKFMLQCANYIKAVRPLPKIAIPKAL